MARSRKKTRRKQKMYNMKGCSKTYKYLGGSPDAPLAYTGTRPQTITNPFFAYTGKGGSSCSLTNPSPIPVNTNAINPAVPNTGPLIQSNTLFNNAGQQKGGCGCGLPTMSGGDQSNNGIIHGGVKHRHNCRCSKCKKTIMKGGNAGIPYPDGLVGTPWTSNISDWPGVNGISGDKNYYVNNTYNNDVSRQMVDVGANPPFLKGGKRRQKGGTLSNFMTQDLVNLGRQFQFGLGSAYNALAGYNSPVNPLPWKDQLSS
jgi:hypothetical protein